LRSEITSVLGEIAKNSTVEKLYTVDFFVKAFALVGDAEVSFHRVLISRLEFCLANWCQNL